MTAPAPYGPCEWCGRPSWLLDPGTGNPAHPCCAGEIGGLGRPICEACVISENARRRWEQRHPPTP